ncbi:MAG: TIGR03986 family CRISPR-associated RAMP protein [Deltaproteobacteria bacterium]|nr:TIGR03986 family CRISPR-associated RAMP protein [Deltaproteobacteria bacterium]
MPRHINPNAERSAHAPYNFVPLPKRMFAVADADGEQGEPWTRHDQFVAGTHSGWIDLSIEALTPLYIRGAASPERDGSWLDRASRLRPDPDVTRDGVPIIPGSSLRGMVRTLVEILSFSKLQPVSEAKPFYRSVADDRIGKVYRSRMMRGGQKPRGGILHIRNGIVTISPREVVRVARSQLRDQIAFRDRTPPWPPQHTQCWVKRNRGSDTVSAISHSQPDGSGWYGGILVLTGYVPKKKREFVFLDLADATPTAIQVPDVIWTRFHDDDQITQWQEKAFPSDRPAGARRHAAGHLRDGEPVFYLVDDTCESEDNPDGLVFLGRAGMFRFPYDTSPRDLVQAVLFDNRLDLAEAIFGKVDVVRKSQPLDDNAAIKGRVRFEDAIATHGGPSWFEQNLVPSILSAPKPTAFQHYLTQDGRSPKDRLTTYLRGDHTTIRGHKLYWHRWVDDQGVSQIKAAKDHDKLLQDLDANNPTDTQHTVMRPIKAGVQFRGRIRFENLTDLELGAVLHALQLPDGCCHRLGMGKPLGLGSIRIHSRLQLVDRMARYQAWQPSGVEVNDVSSRFRTVFEEAMFAHARSSGELVSDGQKGLRRIARLDSLFHLLAWERRPDRDSTDYMDFEKREFHGRRVLPTPHAVAKAREPEWVSDPPLPRTAEGEHKSRPRPLIRGSAPRAEPVQAPLQAKPVGKGQERTGVLKRRGILWVAIIDGDLEQRDAEVVNQMRIPADCADGTKAKFYITEESKRVGIKCRFEG